VDDYRKLVQQHGSIRKAAKAAGVGYTTFRKRLLKGQGTPQTVAAAADRPPSAAIPKGAIDLKNRRVSQHRPPPSAKAYLYTIPKGTGIPITDAARDWNVSVETLRRHARDIKAVCFVEESPEVWTEVVTFPKG
jgi:hypothetical protein